MNRRVGILRCCIALPEDGGCEHAYEFHCVSGEVIEDVQAHPDCPVEIRIEATFDGRTITDWSVMEMAERQGNSLRVALVGVSMTEDGAKRMGERVERDIAKIDASIRRLFNNQIDLVIDPYALRVENTPHIGSGMFWNELQRALPVPHDKYWAWGGSRQGFCGHAYRNSSRGISYSNCTHKTVSHEGGHTIDFGHSGGKHSVYYEKTYMGNAAWRYGWNMPMRHHLDQINVQSIFQLGENDSKRLRLIAPECNEIAVRKGLWKAVSISKSHRNSFFVAYWAYDDTVRVYRTEPENASRWGSTWVLAELKPGESYDGEIEVRHVSLDEGVATVDVKWSPVSGEPGALAPLEPAGAVDVFDASRTGLWHAPDEDLQGLDVHVLHTEDRHQAVVYWYLHDHEGNPIWITGVGHIVDDRALMELYQMKGGRFRKVGTGELYFHEGDIGVWRYYLAEPWAGRDGIVIERGNTVEPHPLYGVWGITGREREGLSVTVNRQPNGDVTVQAFWYTNDGRWRMVDGPLDGEIDVYEVSDAFYRLKSPHAKIKRVGSAKLQAVETSNGKVGSFRFGGNGTVELYPLA